MIEANGLVRRFGDFVAVNGVTLHVPDGTILALLGPNGAGKTTTVRMLAGLLAPSAGTATVAGFDVQRSARAVRARVGLVTDVPGLYEQMTPLSYLDFFGAIYGLSRERRTRRIDDLLAFFDLAEHRRERMAGFSKGMKQKVALARALLHEPAALFLDEPTSGLDPMATRAVRQLVVELKHSSRSIILCTHDLDEAERLADQVAIMRRGQIAAYDTPTALRAHASPESTIHIELAAPSPAAPRALRAIPGVLGLDGASAENATELVYRTADPAAVNPRVVARLVELGAAIVTITSSLRSLEDVYADAMGGVGAQGTDAGQAAEPVADGGTAAGALRASETGPRAAPEHDTRNGRRASPRAEAVNGARCGTPMDAGANENGAGARGRAEAAAPREVGAAEVNTAGGSIGAAGAEDDGAGTTGPHTPAPAATEPAAGQTRPVDRGGMASEGGAL